MEQELRMRTTCRDDLTSCMRALSRIIVSIPKNLIAAPRSSCTKRIQGPLREASEHILPIFEMLNSLVGWLHDNLAQGIGASHKPFSITGDTDIKGMRMDDLLVRLRNLFTTVKCDFDDLRSHICTPTGHRGLVCQHLYGLPRLVAALSSLIRRRARSPADEAIMDLSRDFCTQFAYFDGWCSGLLGGLQNVVDTERGVKPALDLGEDARNSEEDAQVQLDLQVLLSVDPMARLREAQVEAADRAQGRR
ncbi:hypothetical protein EV714DRAFT_268769 [Schizophyllum commune]